MRSQRNVPEHRVSVWREAFGKQCSHSCRFCGTRINIVPQPDLSNQWLVPSMLCCSLCLCRLPPRQSQSAIPSRSSPHTEALSSPVHQESEARCRRQDAQASRTSRCKAGFVPACVPSLDHNPKVNHLLESWGIILSATHSMYVWNKLLFYFRL